jgi:hypothetical protein
VAAPSTWPLPVSPLIAAIAAAGAFVLLVTIVLLVLRARRAGKRKAEVLQALPIRVGELEKGIKGEAAAELPAATAMAALAAKSTRDRAVEAAKTDAARAARVLSAWLLEEGGSR